MSDLIDTTEMYLKTVYELEEEGIVPLRARIAERLAHSGPTVSQTVARMERDGLLVVSGNRQLKLTQAGRARATHVMRKHRLAERLLVDVVGLEWEFVHEEACRWEHVMSERVERRLLGVLDHPHHDPYGNPIPGLDELGEARPAPFLSGVRSLPAVMVDFDADHEAGALPAELVLARIGEPLQVDVDLLARLAEAGLRPGGPMHVRSEDGAYAVRAPGNPVELALPEDLARHLFVQV
ncbi:metal-dependent transcriptional regulator [Georgenia sp. 10Sc9-8]|uniref:Metal-dependent transcriptional regulator n=1 Tax=Georgenia halotolerans TaxID=3028317 RepID=A0ABT5U0U6_9MICO|nr:metal-dependent transcriptional regulator [Georgenia halotolerans]